MDSVVAAAHSWSVIKWKLFYGTAAESVLLFVSQNLQLMRRSWDQKETIFEIIIFDCNPELPFHTDSEYEK